MRENSIPSRKNPSLFFSFKSHIPNIWLSLPRLIGKLDALFDVNLSVDIISVERMVAVYLFFLSKQTFHNRASEREWVVHNQNICKFSICQKWRWALKLGWIECFSSDLNIFSADFSSSELISDLVFLLSLGFLPFAEQNSKNKATHRKQLKQVSNGEKPLTFFSCLFYGS